MVVGIGCNILSSPEVPEGGRDGGRLAACLYDHIAPDSLADGYTVNLKRFTQSHPSISWSSYIPNGSDSPPYPLRDALAEDICSRVVDWIEGERSDTPDGVIRDFEKNMSFNIHRIRPDRLSGLGQVPGSPVGPMEQIQPLFINADGTLQLM
jgi:hypothetical protein